MHQHSHNPKSDLLGIFASGLCLIHCLFGPVVVLLGYSFIEPDGWHIWDIAFLLISALAIFSASRNHGPQWIKNGLWVSFAVLSVGVFLTHSGLFFTVISWLAAAALVVFHVFNIRHARSCPVP